MPEYLDDPSVLTKDKLKSALLAHNVELPSGNPNKDVYVQLYLKNLTSLNSRSTAMTLDAFSSDEELPPPVVSNRSRSSGKKTSRKQEKVVSEVLDVTSLTDEGLRDELQKHGVEAGPIVASTRKLYERKLQKILDEDEDDGEDDLTRPPIVNHVIYEIQVNHNGNTESELYSDKEEEVTPEPDPDPEPVPVAEPEPVPVVEKPVRSRGKTAVTTRTRSSQHQTVEKIAASEQTPKVEESEVLKELFPNDLNSPSGLSVTCRRPIRGAAGRPVKHSDLWNSENFHFSPQITKTTSSTSSYTESRISNRVSSPPVANSSNSSSSSKILAAAPPTGQVKAARSGMSMWKKLLLLAILGAFAFLVYQNMETNSLAPFV